MKIFIFLQYVLGVILLFNTNCLAQSGYNYVRPEAAANNAAAALPNTAIRPIVAAYPTTGTTATGAFPTGVTGFAAPIGPGVTPTTPTAFSPFVGGQNQRLTPTAQSNVLATSVGAFPAVATGATTGLTGRPISTQRTGTSNAIFGGAASGTTAANQARFGLNARGSTITAGDTDLSFEGDGDFSAIPGVPGVDYPIYSQVPQTNFDCAQQPLPGYYSDVEAQCQVFHICALNRTYSFLCPNGTVFSQETLVCVWWNQYDCISAPSLYANNAFIYDYSIGGGSNNADAFNSVSRTQQTNFATSSGRPISSSTSQASGIFNPNAGSLRPTVTSGSFSGLTSPIATAPTSVFSAAGRSTSSNRLASSSSATAQQAFPTTAPVLTAAPFGAVLRSGAGGGGPAASVGGIIGAQNIEGQENAYRNSQLATSPTNREYLPPRRP